MSWNIPRWNIPLSNSKTLPQTVQLHPLPSDVDCGIYSREHTQVISAYAGEFPS